MSRMKISCCVLSIILTVGFVFPEMAVKADEPVVLFEDLFTDGPESYTDKPYYWLGECKMQIKLTPAPTKCEQVELLWGSKKDTRTAEVVVGDVSKKVVAGGWDGFQWQAIPVPESKLGGETLEIDLRGVSFTKAAFFAGMRVSIPKGIPTSAKSWTIETTITLSRTPSGSNAFIAAHPEVAATWSEAVELPTTNYACQDDAFIAAERASRRAAEQFYRSRKFIDGWLDRADPKTGLIPRNLGRDNYWNAKDAAADNYPFMVLTAAMTDRELFEGRMREMLETETRLTCRVDRLPDSWVFATQSFPERMSLDSILFGASEYCKDGLTPVTEWLGPSPWCDRMLGMIDDIFKNANVDTPYGKIPTTNIEVHGELLQILCRAYWMKDDPKYLDWAIRLGDYYLLGGHHPTQDVSNFKLNDHGCEISDGLGELYVTLHYVDPEKKKQYTEPLYAMYDKILASGTDDNGMMFMSFNTATGKPSGGYTDNWGYNYNGMYSVYMVDSVERYRDQIRSTLAGLPDLRSHHWGCADEYADSIEGAINLYNRERVAAAMIWIDSEIDDMWAGQDPDGVIEGWHGDGNIARTALMYALLKTQGLTAQPWRPDLRFGAVERGGKLYVTVVADAAYIGCLKVDRPRHREYLNLPIDFTRLNQFPEWFTACRDETIRVTNLETGGMQELAGEKSWLGIPLTLEAGQPVRLIIEKIEK